VMEPIVSREVASLIIVPDGPLHLIPFSALTTPKGGYLNSKVDLSAAPSATVYYTLRREAKTGAARKPFLGVAFSPAAQSVTPNVSATRGISDLRNANLKPLRFGREEITEAAKVFGPSSVTLDGSQASEAALKARSLGDFKVIHLAAHGLSDDREPDRAALVLAPGGESEDGLWQAREITRSRINADVVVLSACETGIGRLQGQEGVMNLARAFLIAGARSVVASLWAVDDRSTATLMESFYQHLKGGATVNEALRQAQGDFIKDYGDKASPSLWAGFEVIGDGTKRFNLEKQSDLRSAR
ncbi:MAG TPA: CHAT domain-containing protein, partial [Bryobacteraceae bacterium]|nr:CHAT domain-containing protein [Bryobacteraceae bacterium]